jgi:hypothetical protein
MTNQLKTESRYLALLTLFVLGSGLLSNVRAQEEVQVFIADFIESELRFTMEANASQFLSLVNSAYTAKADTLMANDFFIESFKQSFNDLWNGSKFYFPENNIIESVSKLASGRYEMRNVTAYFVDPDGDEHFEETVIQFSPTGMISEFRIGLASHRYQEIMNEGQDVVDISNRETILNFVENFRTAYNRKDIGYINNVFSDQALIIVGRVVETTGETSAYEQQVEYLQFNKEQYIERLAGLFSRNEWIDVGYSEIDIFRHPKYPDIYGVSLTQFYNSSTYCDEGYLFLLIDFKDPKQPMIHVRTWQPKAATPEDEVFHIGFMEIF